MPAPGFEMLALQLEVRKGEFCVLN